MDPIHDADCYTEVVKVKDKAYHELIWTCVEGCKVAKI